MTITIPLWLLPLAFTFISFVVMQVWTVRENRSGGFGLPGRPFVGIPVWIIASLVAWLAWALIV
jgi:hypothetical protein